LKRVVADLTLDRHILQEIVRKSCEASRALHAGANGWRMPSSKAFNGRLRDECLNAHVFASTVEAQRVLDAWRHDYNHVRPHSSVQSRSTVTTSKGS